MSSLSIDAAVASRLVALIDEAQKLDALSDQVSGSGRDVSSRMREGRRLDAQRDGFISSAMNLLEVIFPSPLHAHRLRAASVVAVRGANSANSIAAILEAVKTDLAAGVLRSAVEAARAELFDDFLDHAEHYLGAGRIQPAGVIAGVAFEDTVRRLATKVGVGSAGDKLDQLIIGLEKHGHLTALKAKRARAAADLRTRATHAEWDKFGESDVRSTIEFARELVVKLEG